ncbi:MAG: Xaa-Pro peptidase family protein [Corynebacterium sp.]|nr:Xaa-Pro peptidase family protein [Corynebacterium sp.]
MNSTTDSAETHTDFGPNFYARKLQTVQHSGQFDLIILGPGDILRSTTGIAESTHERFAALAITATKNFAIFPATDDTVIATSILPKLNIPTIYWRDGQDPISMLKDELAGFEPQRIGFDAALRGDHLLALQRAFPNAKFDTVDALFAIKEPEELRELASVGAAIDRVHAQVPALLRAGRTEAEVAGVLEQLILKEHVAVDFIIVGSGPNGAMPHHSYGDRTLQPGDCVVVDIGGTNAAGYHSDCTRTYIVDGERSLVDPEILQAYEVLQQAQQEATAAIRPGMTAGDIDAITRGIIAEAGLGQYFTHRTGHGIGVSTHEPPFIAAGAEVVLHPGMVFSIEPGIYIPDNFGMRIEDIVAVTADGVEVLNQQPRILR